MISNISKQDKLFLQSQIVVILSSCAMMYYRSDTLVPTILMSISLILIGVSKLEFQSVNTKTASPYWRTKLTNYFTLITWIWLIGGTRVSKLANSKGVYMNIYVTIVLAILQLIMAIVSSGIVLLLPIPNMRKPMGKYNNIGTLSFNILLPEGNSNYLPVQCWFPIENKPKNALLNRLSPSSLWTSGDTRHFEQEGLFLLEYLAFAALRVFGYHDKTAAPNWIFHHALLSITHSFHQMDFSNIINADGKSSLPIAIYSHGMHGWRQVHTTACEELASQGFVVFSVDHSPCGSVSRPYGLPDKADSFKFAAPQDTSTHREFYFGGIVRRMRDIDILFDVLKNNIIVSSDASCDFTLVPANGRFEYADKKLQSNSSISFTPFIDFSDVHMWGHSYGGATVATYAARHNAYNESVDIDKSTYFADGMRSDVELCYSDIRIRSVTILDGWFYAVPQELLDRKPNSLSDYKTEVLLLSSELWSLSKRYQNEKEKYLVNTCAGGGLNLVFIHTNHQDYCDLNVFASNFVLKMKPDSIGNIHKTEDINEIICSLLSGFCKLNSSNARKTNRDVIAAADVSYKLFRASGAGDEVLLVNTVVDILQTGRGNNNNRELLENFVCRFLRDASKVFN